MVLDGSKLSIHLSTYLSVKIKGIIGILNALKYNHTRHVLNRLERQNNMSKNIFDTSLFRGASNYETIVRQVAQMCDRVGFSGLENVKLPWAQAVAFSGLSKTELKELPDNHSTNQLVGVIAGHSKLYKYLEQWTLYKLTVSSIHDVSRNQHIRFLEAWMTDSSSFNVFIKRLRYVLQKMHDESSRINRVWYGSMQGE